VFLLGHIRPKQYYDAFSSENVSNILDSQNSVDINLENSPYKFILNYHDFDRVFRVIQKHTLLKLDIIHR